jgi:hypothetical protein
MAILSGGTSADSSVTGEVMTNFHHPQSASFDENLINLQPPSLLLVTLDPPSW